MSAEGAEFNNNKIFEYDVAKLYPGALWFFYLKNYLYKDYLVLTADVALELARAEKILVKDIFLIKHANDSGADNLLSMGANPLLILCFESPLYVGNFYDHHEEYISQFKYKFLPNGLLEGGTILDSFNRQIAFPSYELDKLRLSVKNWGQRKFMVLVASNKYVLTKWPEYYGSPAYLWWWIKNRIAEVILGKRRESVRYSMGEIELLTYRLGIISFFLGLGKLDIYGKGWDRLRGLPPKWAKKLNMYFFKNRPKTCEDKVKTISDYKFCLCVENAAFPGYITEKIIDCYVAGVVPLYIGAPNVVEILPPDSFIDLRRFKQYDQLAWYLEELTESEALKITAAGRNYLGGIKGRCHSYEGFAKEVELLVRDNVRTYD